MNIFQFILTDRVVPTSDVIDDIIRILGDFPSLKFILCQNLHS